MARTLQEVLLDYYYEGKQRRKASNWNKMSWFVTQDYSLIKKDIISGYYYDTESHRSVPYSTTYLKVDGLSDKRVEEINMNGEALYICPCESDSMNGALLITLGWEMIEDWKLDTYVKELS